MIRRIAPAVALALTLLCGCGSPSGAPTSPATGSPGAITVFAAASLRSAFTEIGDQFTADNPGAAVQFSFAGSSDLVTQLTQGAHADVFASADTRNMDKAARAGLLDSAPVDFASNTLPVLATLPFDPQGAATFSVGRPDPKPNRNAYRQKIRSVIAGLGTIIGYSDLDRSAS